MADYIQSGRGTGKTHALLLKVGEAIERGETVVMVVPYKDDKKWMLDMAERVGVPLKPEHLLSTSQLVDREYTLGNRPQKVFVDQADRVVDVLTQATLFCDVDTATLGSRPEWQTGVGPISVQAGLTPSLHVPYLNRERHAALMEEYTGTPLGAQEIGDPDGE